MGEFSFHVNDLVETSFLDDFDGVCINAGFTVGRLSGDKTDSGQAIQTNQLFLYWRPDQPVSSSEELRLQPAWYSMGSKGYAFGGERQQLQLGQDYIDIFSKILEGPPINKSSNMGKLILKLADLGYEAGGNDAASFLGIKCHLKIETLEFVKPNGEKKTYTLLLPVAYLGKVAADQGMKLGGSTAPVDISTASTNDPNEQERIKDIVAKHLDNHADNDFTTISKQPEMQELNLGPAKLFKLADKLLAEGRLTKSADGRYHMVSSDDEDLPF